MDINTDYRIATDEKVFLTPEDIIVLWKRLKKRIKSSALLFALLTIVAVVVSGKIITGWIALASGVTITGLIFISGRNEIEKNQKLVTRGVISARWSRDDEGQRSGLASNYTVVVNGKQIRVDKSIFEKYFKRDHVEFTYTADGFLLSDKLLKR